MRALCRGRLSRPKDGYVRCITHGNHEETGAPRILCRYLLRSCSGGGNHYTSPVELARPDQIWIEAISGAGGGLRNRKARSFAGYCKALQVRRPRRRGGLGLSSDISATNIAEYGSILPLREMGGCLVRGRYRDPLRRGWDQLANGGISN